MSATLRYRGEKRNNFIELAKNLDAFKKVPGKYTETTEIGGTLSLLSRLLIAYLIYAEVRYYLHDADIVYQFQPSIDMDEQVQMHVDITVAMPCTSLSGLDLMDETQQDVFAYGTLQRQGTYWDMAPDERAQFELIQMSNRYLREQYHSIADILFKDLVQNNDKLYHSHPDGGGMAVADGNADNDGHASFDALMSFVHKKGNDKQQKLSEEQYDACRLHGTLGINKVAGVLHLVGGAQPVVGLFDDHLMIALKRMPANFSHRINRLSFGHYSKRIVQPLEGDETILDEEATTVQYFLKIVPTEVHNTFSTINTYQYSVTENVRKLDSEHNSYGSPGIYFKYDWSALKIVVRNDRDNLPTFLIRLCSVISGIIVISGLLNSLILSVHRRAVQKFAPEAHYKLQQHTQNINGNCRYPPTTTTTATTTNKAHLIMNPTPLTKTRVNNDLISTANLMTSLNLSEDLTTPLPLPLPMSLP